MPIIERTKREKELAALLALAALAAPVVARADDPSCAASTSRSRLNFAGRGPVDFGPGFTGELGSSSLGLRYNFLLLGDYDWAMPGNLDLRWPPAFTATASVMPPDSTSVYSSPRWLWVPTSVPGAPRSSLALTAPRFSSGR